MGIIGAVVIARWSWGLLHDTGSVLLDAAINPSLEKEIREAIEDAETRITDLHVWCVGPGKFAAIVSLIAPCPLAPADYAGRVRVHEELIEPHLACIPISKHACLRFAWNRSLTGSVGGRDTRSALLSPVFLSYSLIVLIHC